MKKKVSLIIAGVMIVALVGGGGYLYIQNENAKEAALIQQQEQEAAEKAEAERIAAEKEAAEKAEAERLEEAKKAAEQEAEEQQQTTEATQPPAATEEPKATTDEQQPGVGANAGTGSDGLPDDVIIGSGNTYYDGNQIGQGNTSTVPNSPSTNDGEMSAEEWNAQLPPLQPGTEIGSPAIESGEQVPGAGM
ncbi:hypothetical protein H6B10_06760 [Gemmiger formicilis]|uniref:hypothetical protein n=1 Tax=Gemmiger formicilis TaxID=745368 RepID=UPI00195D1703|nr:hypothetical protein [Gemmiger formicilis]MBM6899408.1 hypothetical protein [Gemmiger formicilis]